MLPVLAKLGVQVPALRGEVNRALDELPRLTTGSTPPATQPSSELGSVLQAAEREARELSDQYVSTEHLLLALSKDQGPAGRALRAAGASHERLESALAEVRGPHRVTDQNPEEKYQALERYRTRPHRAGRAGQARPGDRPRRGDPARDPGALPADQEQPGADRRAGRRQDGDRRGPRPADRLGRRPRVAAGTARDRPRHRRAGRRGEVPGRVRGSPEGRPPRDLTGRRHRDPVPRRAPHDRRRGGGRRGRGRGQPAQADARPRRTAGVGATTLDEYRKHIEKDAALGASLPARDGRRAVGRPTRSRSCAG